MWRFLCNIKLRYNRFLDIYLFIYLFIYYLLSIYLFMYSFKVNEHLNLKKEVTFD